MAESTSLSTIKKHGPNWQIAFVTALCLGASQASASLLFDFQQEGTGTVLATLEATGLPFTPTPGPTAEGLLALTFTAEGQAIFGQGPTYLGTFDGATGLVHDDGAGGLMGPTPTAEALVIDGDAPGGGAFVLEFRSPVNQDAISIRPSFPGLPTTQVFGDWVFNSSSPSGQVPEPASVIVWTFMLGASIGVRRWWKLRAPS